MHALATTFEAPRDRWSELRLRIASAVAERWPAQFLRLGEVAGHHAVVDHIGVAGIVGDDVALAFAGGDRMRAGASLFRIDDDDGPIGVLVSRRRTTPSLDVLRRLAEGARELERLVPETPTHLVLRGHHVVHGCAAHAAWQRWPPLAALIAGAAATKDAMFVHQGSIARVTPLGRDSDLVRLVVVARAPRAVLDPMALLTPAQRRIVGFAAVGATRPEIARSLGISQETVRTHLRDAYRRLGIASRAELAGLVAKSSC